MTSMILLLTMAGAPFDEAWQRRDSCSTELNRMHIVRAGERAFLLYGDPDVAAYLQWAIGGPLGMPVAPVFTDEPVALLDEGKAIVSTGMIMRVHGIEELRAAFRQMGGRKPAIQLTAGRRGAILPSCAGAHPAASFEQMRERLALDLRQYAESTKRALRLRPARR